jgi:hypothetical protein
VPRQRGANSAPIYLLLLKGLSLEDSACSVVRRVHCAANRSPKISTVNFYSGGGGGGAIFSPNNNGGGGGGVRGG